MGEMNDKKGGNQFMQYRPVLIALIAGICAIICVSIMTGNVVDYKRSAAGSGFSATGSASVDFESDLVVWRGSFSVHGDTPKEAYAQIRRDGEIVRSYLQESGVTEDEMIFSSVSISQTYTSRYDEEGRYIGDEPDGYELTQAMTANMEYPPPALHRAAAVPPGKAPDETTDSCRPALPPHPSCHRPALLPRECASADPSKRLLRFQTHRSETVPHGRPDYLHRSANTAGSSSVLSPAPP